MNGGNGLEFGGRWAVLYSVADVLAAISFLALFATLALVASARETAKYRRSLILFAIFILSLGVNRILVLTGPPRLQNLWNLASAAIAIVTAIVIVASLPRYLRLPKIAEELRSQAGFLEEQQALLHAIQDSVSDGILLIAGDGQIKAFNAAALRILFGAQGESSTPSSKSLPEMKQSAIRALAETPADQGIVQWEGRLIERFTTSVPPYGQLFVFRDITMRRQLEEQRLRVERVIASMKEGFAIVAFDSMRIVSANPALEQMLGYGKDELTGLKFSEVQAGYAEESQAAMEAVAGIVARDGFWEGEIRNRRKDGSELIAHTTFSRAREGESQYLSCIQVDITEQKRLREEKERLQTKLMETQRLESLGRLAGGAGHEFNNLLTGIMGSMGLALDLLPPGDPAADLLVDAMRASERAAAVSRQLLYISGNTGRAVVRPVDVSNLVKDLAAMAQASISKKVELRTELAADLPAVEADVPPLRQVVLNLVSNGAAAIGDAAGIVTVSTGAEGRCVYLQVTDTGCGMDEEMQARIFDPFYSTRQAATGLGLAAALGIVRAHQGEIKVESEPGQGSAFRVLLPAAETARNEPAPPSDPSCRLGTILVVEDEPIVRRTTLAVLTQHGYDVRAAENGAAGVEMFREMADEISLVLLDIAMPVMGGEETLALIKQIRPGVPVLITSGRNGMEAGADGVLKKPYTARQLVEKLTAMLEKRVSQAGGL